MKTTVVGLGRQGRRLLQAAAEAGVEIAGICDINPEVLAAAGQERGVSAARQFTDVRRMLKTAAPDCVIIATTAPTHREYTCLAADAGARYILCEKPMAVSIAQCEEMIARCRERGAALAINHPMRFMAYYKRAKDIAWSDRFGGATSVTVVTGNIGLAMNGTHYVEMFRYLVDERPESVVAWMSDDRVPNPRGAQFEDRAGAMRLVTASGRRMYLEAGADQGHGLTVIIGGRNGQIVLDELAGQLTVTVRNEEHRTLPTTRYGMPWVTDVEQVTGAEDVVGPSRQVLEVLLRGDGYPSGEDGLLAVAALVGAHVSHESGHRAVALDAQLPRDREFPWA